MSVVERLFEVTDSEARRYYAAMSGTHDVVGEAVIIKADRGPCPWFYAPHATKFTWYVREVLDGGRALRLVRTAR